MVFLGLYSKIWTENCRTIFQSKLTAEKHGSEWYFTNPLWRNVRSLKIINDERKVAQIANKK